MSLNSPSDIRTSIPDFVYAASNPTSPLGYLDYMRVNQVNNNIEGDWEIFQTAGHSIDGEHSAIFKAGNVEYISNYLFRIAGGYIHFKERRMVKLDCGADGIKYDSVETIFLAGGYTYFLLKQGLATANLDSAYFGIQDALALPHGLYRSAFHAADDTNLLNASGDYTSPIFSDYAAFTRIQAQGLFYLNGRPYPDLILQKISGGSYVEVKTFKLNQIASGFSMPASTSFRVFISGSDGSVCKTFLILLG